MDDQSKTKHDLIQELVFLRKRIAELSQYESEHKQVEESLRESEDKYKSLIENIPDIIFITIDLEGKITFISKRIKEILGYEDAETINRNIFNFIPKEDHQRAMEILQKGMKGEKIKHVQLPVTAKSGKKLFFDFSFSRIYKDGVVVGAQGTAVDVTERKRAEEALKQSEAKYRLLADHMQDYVWLMDLNLQWTYISPSGEKLLGYTLEELKRLPLDKLLTATSYQIVIDIFSMKMETALTAPTLMTLLELECHCKDGRTLWIESTLSFIRDDNSKPLSILGEGRDITERKKAEEALKKSEQRYLELSIIDDLTQLYNSRHFYSQLKKEIERSNRYEQPLTLLLLDLDKFKKFNDTYGHVEGDDVLLRLGQVIKRCLRETDSAYRYGGEEFTIMLPMTTSEEGIVTAKRIQTELRKEGFSPALGKEVYMTVSIGLAQYRPKEDMRTFVNRVDRLMYQAKKDGRDRICPES
jgi:diguanylate cyclase (GGDEF)-like protein/PAS domain S-box-containing protein